MTPTLRSAEERRAEIQRQAAEMGVDDAYISVLVDSFYAKIRRHPALGPIFAREIGDDWDEHLPKMKDFWASVALNAGRYSGKPVPAHMKIEGISRGHFDVWLGLFRETLEETAPTPEAVSFFMERAERIAQSLQMAIFGLDGIVEKRKPSGERRDP